MNELNIQQSIIKALSQMSKVQQIKLLEFINAMLSTSQKKSKADILRFKGVFDDRDVQEFESSLKDCEQIDYNE